VGDTTEPVTRWIETSDGVRLRALDWGGNGPPVVLLHGGALTARTWDYVAAGLRAAWRLVALDLRGHGESGWSEDYSPARMGRDAVEAVEALRLERPHVAGMSLGGLAAAEFALAWPQVTRSLAMIDVGPGSVFEATAAMRGFMNGMIAAPSVEAVIEGACRLSPNADPQRIAYRMAAMLRERPDGFVEWRNDRRRQVDFPAILERIAGLAERVASFPRPALVVRGGRSRPFPEAAAAAFAARFRDGRLIEIPDAGHNVQEDNPKALIEALSAFWSGA
jgi:pimeloyl-ACP methyl ester carboxylesterase